MNHRAYITKKRLAKREKIEEMNRSVADRASGLTGGQENNSARSTAWAKLYLGLHLRKVGLDAESLEALEEGLRHWSDGMIGRLLSQAVAQAKSIQ